MEIHRIGIKLFAADPASIDLEAFVPVFHGWIQKQIVPGHLLVDVHNYSHIQDGPGILLVAHEGNFSMDKDQGQPGLFYYRKQPLNGSPEARIAQVLKTALNGASVLEDDPALEGRVRFRTDELLVIGNDRLHIPNDEQTFSQIQPVVSGVMLRLLDGAGFKMSRVSTNPRERFSIRVETGQAASAKTLLARM